MEQHTFNAKKKDKNSLLVARYTPTQLKFDDFTIIINSNSTIKIDVNKLISSIKVI